MSTRDKYKRARNDRDQSAPMQDNEIRVSANRGVAPYIRYALGILTRDNKDTVIIQSSGGAIPIGCLVAEIVRRRVPDLHQLNQISSTDIEDVYYPLEEGLDKVVIKKTMAVLRITLTKNGESLKHTDAGYQAPLPASEVRGLEPRGGEGGEYEGEGGERPKRGPRRGGDREGGRGGRRGGRGGGRGGNRDREGGYRTGGGQRRGGDREGGDREGGEREGGYRGGNRRGGDREGGDREGGYRTGGGYRGPRDGGNREGGEREGGYRSGGGYRGGNRDGGDREGGYRTGGGYRGGNRDGGRDGGNREGGDREGGYRTGGGQRRDGAPSGRRVTRGGGTGGSREGGNTGRFQGPSN